MNERRLRLAFAAGVFLVVLAVYLYSAAPTASFWDCGEFIAVSYILGVPHPPGTPLFVMIGRIFAMIPFAREIAFRVNFISVLAGSLAAALAYLLIVKLIGMWKDFVEPRLRVVPHLAGVAGAFFMAFAFSIWDNAVEAEVYTTCAAVALALVYAALVWRDQVAQGRGDNRLVLLALYLTFVAAAIHLTPVLVLPAFLLFVYLVDRRAVLALRVLELLVLMIIAAFVAGRPVLDYIVLITASPTVALAALGSPRFWVLVGLVVFYTLYLFWLARRGRLDLRYVAFAIGLVLIAGTIQFYLMVRAGHHPAINECNPSRWSDFLGMLQRSQYEPMKLLPRKTQFLSEDDYYRGIISIGFWQALWAQIVFYVRYFFWQWRWQSVIGFLPPVLGIVGGWALFRRDKKAFILLAVCFLLASFGLLGYLNLKYSPSDAGALSRFREVRERDYFFAFSYVFYAIFAGLGIAGLLGELARRLRLRALLQTVIAGAGVVLAIAFLFINYREITRRHNWIPAEYGYNMLSTADRGIVFTNGDNDTFPLWFVQEVPSRVNGYRAPFRPEVVVANLSLINTTWYIHQLKAAGVPISFSDEQIDQLEGFRPFLNRDNRPVYLKDVMTRNIIATSAGVMLEPGDYAASSAEFQAKVLANYQPRYPVFFANTVSADNLADVRDATSMEGLFYRVVRPGSPAVNVERSQELIARVYRTASMLDPRVRRDDNTRTLLVNYAGTYLQLAGELRARGDVAGAEAITKQAARFDLDPVNRRQIYYNLAIFATQMGRFDEAFGYLDSIAALGFADEGYFVLRGIISQQRGDLVAAESCFIQARNLEPNSRRPIERLVALYLFGVHDTDRALGVMREWLQRHPSDTATAGALQELEYLRVHPGKSPSTNSR